MHSIWDTHEAIVSGTHTRQQYLGHTRGSSIWDEQRHGMLHVSGTYTRQGMLHVSGTYTRQGMLHISGTYTMQGIVFWGYALGTRHQICDMRKSGHSISDIHELRRRSLLRICTSQATVFWTCTSQATVFRTYMSQAMVFRTQIS